MQVFDKIIKNINLQWTVIGVLTEDPPNVFTAVQVNITELLIIAGEISNDPFWMLTSYKK